MTTRDDQGKRYALGLFLPQPGEFDELSERDLLLALVVWAAEVSARLDALDPHQPGGGPSLVAALVGGMLRGRG